MTGEVGWGSHRVVHEGGLTVRRSTVGAEAFFSRNGWRLDVAPSPPRLDVVDPLAPATERLAAQGIMITRRTLPTWEGGPFNLGYAVEALYEPPALSSGNE